MYEKLTSAPCQFHKEIPNEVFAGPNQLPNPSNADYTFIPDRDPCILDEAFSAGFNGCSKTCFMSYLDLLCLFHECSGRGHCGRDRLLQRLPKRLEKWDIANDHAKDEAWGINTVFQISFIRMLAYHVLILLGPVVSWGLWLKRWPKDWQNAAVPFFAVVVLLSLLWMPIIGRNR